MHPNLAIIKAGHLRREDLFAAAAHERLLSQAAAASPIARRGRAWIVLTALAAVLVALSRGTGGDLLKALGDGPHT